MTTDLDHILSTLRDGGFVIVIDDDEPDTTGDLLLSAGAASAEQLNFMMLQARGTMAVALTAERLTELDLPPMVSDSWDDDGERAAFAVSVDARAGGDDSAAGKATTIRALVAEETTPRDLLRPGHVLPIRAAPGGTLVRAAHTEAAVDLTRLAGLYPAGVTCRVLTDTGEPAHLAELREFADRHDLPMVSIADVIRVRRRGERLVERQAQAFLPTVFGDFDIIIYTSVLDGADYVAIVKGDPATCEAPLVRVHSGCVTGDILGSRKCDCGWQLSVALTMIAEAGCGVVVYIPSHEGRGIGLANKIRAYHLQEEGLDTVEANEALGFPPDLRDYGLGAQVLADLGLTKMRLMTNNPKKYAAMAGYGLEVVERVPLECPSNEYNLRYLLTKRDKMGHLLTETAGTGEAETGNGEAGKAGA
ncbi:GTP cyclohydrolase II [bacterium]|nr:GTP cyclohydrolase II [bacterium]